MKCSLFLFVVMVSCSSVYAAGVRGIETHKDGKSIRSHANGAQNLNVYNDCCLCCHLVECFFVIFELKYVYPDV